LELNEQDIKDNLKETETEEKIIAPEENEPEQTANDKAEDKISSEENISTQLEERTKQCEELTDRLQRSLAEFDNFRKRTAREKASMYEDGMRDTVEKLLPVLDNFERAMKVIPENESENNFYKGIDMIFKQFTCFLDDLGIEPIESVGKPFDPNIHYAVSHIESEDHGENTIVEELQKGYKHRDKVIRTSMVQVAN